MKRPDTRNCARGGIRRLSRGVGIGVVRLVMLLAGCGRYANFSLPETFGGDQSIAYRFLPESRGTGANAR